MGGVSEIQRIALAIAAAVVAGAINAIAGGGTLLTFPALVGVGLSPLLANATSTVALWPGAVGSMWAYRRELVGVRAWTTRFAVPSLAGGLLGAWLLLVTPADRFAAIVPWLVLSATILFMLQPVVTRAVLRRGRTADAARSAAGNPRVAPADASTPAPDDRRDAGDATLRPPPAHVLAYQFVVGIYGGYFGAGVGILMLAALGFMGLRNIHRMNGLKNWGGLCMNAVAAVTFAMKGLVDWPLATAMAVGSVAGGYLGAGLAQRVPQPLVRKAVMAVGLASAVWLLTSR